MVDPPDVSEADGRDAPPSAAGAALHRLHSLSRSKTGVTGLDDLRYPNSAVSTFEALSRRLRRVYGLLFVIAGLTWVVKITILTPQTA
ncbi:DUF2270 domain-containing protein [Haloprofundus halobius]|uniref:DUF2270 domain-containing protein n=1 Tax=Haloprofundus halobius TaxID=2876194 RepID=UPI001CCE93DC